MRIGQLATFAGAPPGVARCSSVGSIDGALHARAALLRGGGRVHAAERLAGPGAVPSWERFLLAEGHLIGGQSR